MDAISLYNDAGTVSLNRIALEIFDGVQAGKGDAVQRLCGNLQVDIFKARSLLGWLPPVSVDEGLRRAVAGNGLPSI